MNEPLRQREPRVEDRDYLAWIRTLPCSVPGCRRYPVEAAHVRYACLEVGKRETGRGERPSDKWAVPLCSWHHRQGPKNQHSVNERAWWKTLGVDPLVVAQLLAREYEFQRRGP